MQTEAVFAAPLELEGLHRRIQAWWQTRRGTRTMPQELWKQASGFAQKLGICKVSRALRVNYGGLKRRVLAGRPPGGQSKERSCAVHTWPGFHRAERPREFPPSSMPRRCAVPEEWVVMRPFLL
jgi:hypothetical protein